MKLFAILTVVILATGVFFFTRSKTTPAPVASTPQNFLSATIEKVSGNTVYVDSSGKKYKIKVTDKTNIYGSITALPFALSSATPPQPQKLTIADLKTGIVVNISTKTDLNKNVSDLEVNSISLPFVTTTISGKILSLENDVINLKAPGYRNPADLIDAEKAASLPLEKDYQIKLTAETKVFQTNKEASVSDLQPDMNITVYSDTNVTTTDQITAKYIEIVPAPPSNPAAENPAAQPTLENPASSSPSSN